MADDYETSDKTETKQTSDTFIDYQQIPTTDNNCELSDAEPIPESSSCSTCTPNPGAPLIDWTKTDDTSPFLNERKCTYSICLITQYEGTGGPTTLQKRLDEYVDEGALKLLAHFNKALDANTVKAAKNMAGATDHFIPPRARLKMKVLIELPANEFDALPDAVDIPEVDDSVQEAAEDLGLSAKPSSSATVDFELFDQQMDKLIEGLKVYGKFQAIFIKPKEEQYDSPVGHQLI